MADQGLVDFREFVERVDGAAFDLHGLEVDLGFHHAIAVRRSQAGTCRGAAVGR